MKVPTKVLIIGAAGALAVGAITPALAKGLGDHGGQGNPAATGSPRRPGAAKPGTPLVRGIIAEVAKALNMKPEDLLAQLKAGETLKQVIEAQGSTVAKVVDILSADLKTRLDAAVKAGKLTQAQEDKQLAAFKERTTNAINNGGAIKLPANGHKGLAGKPPAGPRGPGVGIGNILQSVAKQLNIDPKALMQSLKDGKTLKQAIEAQGQTEDAVVDALASQVKTKLDAAVKAGRMTQEQADKALAAFKDQARKIIESTAPAKLGGARGQNGPGPLSGRIQRGIQNIFKATADALKMDPKDVRAQIVGGKSLAQVIQENGSTVNAVVDAIAATAKTKLDEAVKAGKLTQAQEDQAIARLKERLTKAIESPRHLPQRPAKPAGGKTAA